MVPLFIKRSQISNPLKKPDQASKYEKDYKQAYTDSGAEEFYQDEKNNPKSTEQAIHSSGAHEETHLLEEYDDDQTYESEKDAFTNQVQAEKDYIKEVQKPQIKTDE